jgi:hypothetical protein
VAKLLSEQILNNVHPFSVFILARVSGYHLVANVGIQKSRIRRQRILSTR